MPLKPEARAQKLKELKKLLEAHITDRQEQLHIEYEFLKLVLEKQGLVAASRRRTGNIDKMLVLATAKDLLPTTFVGKDATEQQKVLAANLAAIYNAPDPFAEVDADEEDE
jgi:hypothetical protein